MRHENIWCPLLTSRVKGIAIRRIASLDNPNKIKWLIKKTQELSEVESYGLRVYKPDAKFPVFGLEIIDRKKVFIFGPHGRARKWAYIESLDFAEGVSYYFDTLWAELEKGSVKEIGNAVSDPKVIEDSFKAIAS